jgi:hypothetical protein
MDTEKLRQAHEDFIAVAREGDLGPPPAGEWDAGRLLAHVASADASIASVALAVIAGQRPSYDNRASLDEWNLRRIVGQAGGIDGLLDLVRRQGDLLCAAGAGLAEAEESVLINVLIISNDQVVVDEPRSIGSLVEGVGTFHLPRHAEQLSGLRS